MIWVMQSLAEDDDFVTVFSQQEWGLQFVATLHIDAIPAPQHIWKDLRAGERVRVEVTLKREEE